MPVLSGGFQYLRYERYTFRRSFLLSFRSDITVLQNYLLLLGFFVNECIFRVHFGAILYIKNYLKESLNVRLNLE